MDRKCSLKFVALVVKQELKNSENESVANHSKMSWTETTKWINARKGKPDDSSRKGEVITSFIGFKDP